MTFEKIKTEIWVNAYLRYLNLNSIPVYILKKGDNCSGAIFIKVVDNNNYSKVFGRIFNNLNLEEWDVIKEGNENEVKIFLDNQIRFDPDLWLIEVEDNFLRNFLEKFE